MAGDLEGEDDLQLPLLAEPRGDGAAPCGPAEGRQGATIFQTSFNICNIFMGTGLLALPFAVMRGGWTALGVQAVLLPIFALSGQLICSAFELLPSRIPRTYPALGQAAAGRNGTRAVLLFSFMELFGGSCILIMVAWKQLELLLPAEGLGPLLSLRHWAAAISTLLLLPLLFIDLRRLSRLSVVGLCSSGMVVALVLALVVLDPRREGMPQQPPPSHHVISSGILQAVGVFALSSTCHSALPALRTAMRRPERFPAALAVSFATMLLTYSSIAAAGYYYWGDSASPLLTSDLARNSWYTMHSSVPVHRVLAAFVLVNTLTKYPGLNLCLQDMILSVLPLDRDPEGNFHPPLHWAATLLRLALCAAGTLLALTAYDVLGNVLSLLGGLGSISCSLLLPTACYARLAWRQLGVPARTGLVSLLALGCALVVLITGLNVCDMLPRCVAWREAGLALA